MELIFFFEIFHMIFALIAFLLACATGFLLWRFRGILRWRKSLSQELKAFKKDSQNFEGARNQAHTIVLKNCEQIQHAFMADITIFEHLPDYICEIAACYHPDKKNPEQCITIGNFLSIAQEIAYRIDNILKLPGLKRFRKLRICQIIQTYERIKKIQKNPFMSIYLKYRKYIQKIAFIRLIILPDPFSWLFYLSNQFTIVTLTRYLLLEIYFYTGQLAIKAYGQSETHNQQSFSKEELELLMMDLENFKAIDGDEHLSGVKLIRKKYLGFGKGLVSELSISNLKKALIESTQTIASHHFPDTKEPVLEASVGPLLERSRYWVKIINKIQSMPIVYKMTDVRIEILFQAKFMIDSVPPNMKQAVMSIMKVYNWAKWPLTIYRIANKFTPIGVATSLGWIFTRTTIVFYIYQYTFYTACNELNAIYFNSLDDDKN